MAQLRLVADDGDDDDDDDDSDEYKDKKWSEGVKIQEERCRPWEWHRAIRWRSLRGVS